MSNKIELDIKKAAKITGWIREGTSVFIYLVASNGRVGKAYDSIESSIEWCADNWTDMEVFLINSTYAVQRSSGIKAKAK